MREKTTLLANALLLIGLSLMLLNSCEKDDPQSMAVLTTTEVTEILQEAAVSGGNITNDGDASVTARGVCWSTNQTPTINDSKTTNGTGTGSFTANISSLTAGTSYYVRAYAINSVGTSYGNTISFTTLISVNLPTIATTEVTDVTEITQTTVVVGGEISDDGGAEVTAVGVCWSTNDTPTIDDNKTVDGTGAGSFNSTITGLSPGTTYYVRVYATNSEGTAYGNVVTIETLAELPTLTTTSLSNVTATSVDTGGNISSDGGADITARGVCYDISPNPTIDGPKTSNGVGVGSFVSSISGLSAGVTYYIRAYATNSVGTVYGNELRANGLSEDINNLVPELIIDELKELGMPINTGITPPIINGIYSINPLLLKNSNIVDDYSIGHKFNEVRVRIYDQNNTTLTIKYEDASISSSSGNPTTTRVGTHAYIVGNGAHFTIFVRVLSTKTSGEWAELVYIMSGTKVGENINSMYRANFMLNNNGYEGYMDNGEGRVLYDEDGVSEKIPSITSAVVSTRNSLGVELPCSESKR